MDFAPCYARPYISDRRCLPGDDAGVDFQRLRPQEKSAELKAAAVKSSEDYGKQQALQIVTLGNIADSRELYGSEDMTHISNSPAA